MQTTIPTTAPTTNAPAKFRFSSLPWPGNLTAKRNAEQSAAAAAARTSSTTPIVAPLRFRVVPLADTGTFVVVDGEAPANATTETRFPFAGTFDACTDHAHDLNHAAHIAQVPPAVPDAPAIIVNPHGQAILSFDTFFGEG